MGLDELKRRLWGRVADREVRDSPHRSGLLTGISDAGYAEVDGVAVAWVLFEDDALFDPDGLYPENSYLGRSAGGGTT